jgi:hypothetical protein
MFVAQAVKELENGEIVQEGGSSDGRHRSDS